MSRISKEKKRVPDTGNIRGERARLTHRAEKLRVAQRGIGYGLDEEM